MIRQYMHLLISALVLAISQAATDDCAEGFEPYCCYALSSSPLGIHCEGMHEMITINLYMNADRMLNCAGPGAAPSLADCDKYKPPTMKCCWMEEVRMMTIPSQRLQSDRLTRCRATG
jgi:hypothetical protein